MPGLNVIDRRALLTAATAMGIVPIAPAAKAQSQVPYSWVSVPWGGGGFVDGFVYHPKERGLLYTRTDVGGAYRFDAVQKRWQPLLDHLGLNDADLMGVLAIALDPNNADRIYLACGEYLGQWAQDAAILCSSDRGATWSKTPLGFKLGGNADGRGTGERLQVDPNSGNVLFLGTNQNGLYKSVDEGKSFASVAFPEKNVTLVIFDPSSGASGSATQVLYVGAGAGKGGLYKSTDGGASFTLIEGLPSMFPQRAALDQIGNLYVTLSNGLAPTGDLGSVWRCDVKTGKWRNVSPMKPGGGNPNFAYCGVDVDLNRPGTVIVSTMNRWSQHDDIFLSRDGGEHWKPIGPQARHSPAGYPWLVSYMKGEDVMGHWIADVKIDPFNSDACVYGTGYGLWMTDNLGQIDGKDDVHFKFVVENLEETCTIAMASPPAGPMLYVAVGDVGGAAYDDIGVGPKSGLFAPTSETNQSIEYAELAPEIAVRTADQARSSGYYSTDGGLSWKPFASSPRVGKGADGQYHVAGRVAVSAEGKSLVWAPGHQGAYFSRDMGHTWTESQGWPVTRDISHAPVADRAVDGVFYVHDCTSRSILISVDAGATFKPIIVGLPEVHDWENSQLLAAPGRIRDLWLATPQGLFHSPDEKAPLKALKGVDQAWLFALGKAREGKAYHALYLWGMVKGKEGIWRSDDAGDAWVRINDDHHQFGALRTLAADPLDFGTVYLGPHGRGVIVGKPA